MFSSVRFICFESEVFFTDVVEGIPSGFYNDSIYVNLDSKLKGSVIYYTLSGATPTLNSILYTAPVYLTASKVIRARVYATGMIPSRIKTQTYLFRGSAVIFWEFEWLALFRYLLNQPYVASR